MTDVHAGTRRVWELDESVPLRLLAEVYRLEGLGLFPLRLPLRFDLFKIILHNLYPLVIQYFTN